MRFEEYKHAHVDIFTSTILDKIVDKSTTFINL